MTEEMADPSIAWMEESGFSDASRRAYFGHATVRHVDCSQVLVECSVGTAWATMAMVIAYQPEEGDVVLVLGTAEGWYVIGIVEGKGKTVIHSEGDLALAARARLRLVARDGIHAHTRRFKVVSAELRWTARSLVSMFKRVSRFVSGDCYVSAGQVHVDVDGRSKVEADEIFKYGENGVEIDGARVDLA